MRKQLYIIAYDVTDDKCRTAVANLLEATGGIRRNKSVFECMFSIPVRKRILTALQLLIDTRTDTILCYKVCKSCYTYTQYIPENVAPPQWKDITVV